VADRALTSLAPEEVKACCASAYASPAARWLLGESFHPGGAELTSRLVRGLRVGPGQTLVDVASGPGTSALSAARETGCDVIGIDLSPESVAAATRAAAGAGLAGRVRFLCGDAEALPLPDASADGVLCECALCTFPDKAAAAGELARVLRPGGRLALSDMTAVPERLPAALTGVAAWVACLGGAEPLERIAARLGDAGLEVETTERHDEALGSLLERIRFRLRAARIGATVFPGGLKDGVDRALLLVEAAEAALADRALGYGVVIARKP
jgi:hypothetical protein